MAVGTLTALPVPAPRVIDRRVAGGAMVLAPLAAVPLLLNPGEATGLHRVGDHVQGRPRRGCQQLWQIAVLPFQEAGVDVGEH